MATSQAKVEANRRNAQKSTGPKTEEGKARSRCNAVKHGLTGQGVALLQYQFEEVNRLAEAFMLEFNGSSESAAVLARRAALHALRLERAEEYETTLLYRRIKKVEADYVPAPDTPADDAEQVEASALRHALFDPSPEAERARLYEARTERAFLRTLDKLKKMQVSGKKEVKARQEERVDDLVASLSRKVEQGRRDDQAFDRFCESFEKRQALDPLKTSQTPSAANRVDVPFTIGKRE